MVVQYCPRCGARNAAREPLCGSCGQKLYGLFGPGAPRTACGICDAANPGSAEFCVRCGRAVGGQLSRPGERLTVAAPAAVPKRREGPKVVVAATLPPPKPAYGAGCLGGIAAAVLLVVGVGLWVGLGARGVSLALPGTWRASGEVSVAELVQAAERLERGSVGLAVGAGPSGRAGGADGFALPLATPAPPIGVPLATQAPPTGVSPATQALPTGGLPATPTSATGGSLATPPAGGSPPWPTVPAGGSTARGAAAGGGIAGGVPSAPEAPAPAVELARRGALIFGVTALEARPAGVGRRRLDMGVALQNVGGTALAYDAALARVESAAGERHAPVATVEQPLAQGLLAAGEGTVLALRFDVPEAESRLTLVYDGIPVDLGEATLRTFRPPPPPQ